jgi:FdrA protein
VGASGTGLQEYTTLLDAAGYGITHAIGTGGRDLSEAVAGRTSLAAIDLLADDPKTEIIAIVSKPPSEIAEKKVIAAVKKAGKPAVLAFLGRKSAKLSPTLYIAATIEEAVAKTVALCRSQDPSNDVVLYAREPMQPPLLKEIEKLSNTQRIIKGLYTGGTLASETKFILKEYDHTVIDLGDDEYTRGSLHPMIDPSNRTEHVLEAFSDPKTAVLICDVVIGFGSHMDPAGMLSRDIVSARKKTGANVIVIASVTGTDADPQSRQEQVKKLEEVGIWVYPTNQYAAEVSAQIAKIIQKGDGR